ncbi:outer membrane beta-barrel protein [Helicobacter pylori]|uniref:outer membrane beta-barrel protein n=1 Tax=Helicobacter pylori TaxID=210 RepID=UPI001E495142|nr:outer membrane beta-barrel protein [Helicobacter pylori]
MKKSFKKLGFVSLATSSVLLGSMNATDLETYAALQKPSHVFGNYVAKTEKEDSKTKDGKDSKDGGQVSQQQQAQTTASSDSTQANTAENTATTDGTTATTDEAYANSTDTTVANAAKQVETDKSAVQTAEKALEKAVDQVKADASTKDFDETTFTKDQTAEQTAEKALETAENKLTQDQQTLETDLQDQKKAPTSSTPPTKAEPSSSGNSVASQLVKDTTTVNNLKSVSVSSMNTTLSGIETMSQQSATIGNLLNSSTDLSSVIPNAQGLSSAFGALESAQNTLKGYLDSSSATIGQLTNGSNAVVGTLDKAINQVDTALADLNTTDTQKTQAVTLATTGSSTNSTTTDAINFLNVLKTNLMAQKMAQKDAFMNVHKNIQTAVAQAQATYTPSVINTNNYGQMYGVDAMAGYKWFFGKTKRFGFRTYGYYSYNHANLSFVGSQLGIMEGASQVNNFTYGVGFDALYNFYESKEGYNTAGLFVGFGLGGDSFIVQGESYLKSQMHICNNTAGCSASMNTSYFQMPVEFGFRSNFSKHSGIEVGFKLPLFTNQFYKERGVDGSVDVFYKRNFSIYFNYMINF